MASVVQAEIARHACQDHAVGFFQGFAALVPELQRVLAPKQAPRHARQVDGDAKPRNGAGGGVGIAPR